MLGLVFTWAILGNFDSFFVKDWSPGPQVEAAEEIGAYYDTSVKLKPIIKKMLEDLIVRLSSESFVQESSSKNHYPLWKRSKKDLLKASSRKNYREHQVFLEKLGLEVSAILDSDQFGPVLKADILEAALLVINDEMKMIMETLEEESEKDIFKLGALALLADVFLARFNYHRDEMAPEVSSLKKMDIRFRLPTGMFFIAASSAFFYVSLSEFDLKKILLGQYTNPQFFAFEMIFPFISILSASTGYFFLPNILKRERMLRRNKINLFAQPYLNKFTFFQGWVGSLLPDDLLFRKLLNQTPKSIRRNYFSGCRSALKTLSFL